MLVGAGQNDADQFLVTPIDEGDFGHIWNNRPIQGQTFMTGSDPNGYLLHSFAMRNFENNVTNNTATWTGRVGTISGTTFTPIASENSSNSITYVPNDYIRFTFATPVSLNPNTVYGFDLDTTGSGFVTANNADSNYTGGQGYSSGDNGVPTDNNLAFRTADRLFHLDMVVDVPGVNAMDDSGYAANEDTTLNVASPAAGVLANDSPGFTVVSNTSSVQGAAVAVAADGTFTYNPAPSASLQTLDEGATVTDTFNYTISNAAPVFTAGPITVEVYNGTSDQIATADNARGSNTTGAPVNPGQNAAATVALADLGTNGTASFPGEAGVPAPGGGDSYAVFLTTTIQVDNTGNPGNMWTFGVHADDASRIRIDLNQNGILEGPLAPATTSSGETIVFLGGCCANTRGTPVMLADGVYDIEMMYTEGGGGDYGEYFYARGSNPAFDTTTYALIGDNRLGITTGTVAIPGGATTETATVSVVVTGVNDAPVANPDSLTIREGSGIAPTANPIGGNVLTNDTDVDDPNIAFTVTAPGTLTGTYGTLAINANGTYTYTLDEANPVVNALRPGNANLQDVFNYTMSDNHSGGNVMTANSSLTINIVPTNDEPVPVNDPTTQGPYQIGENGGVLSIGAANGVLVNDTDPDSTALGVVSINTTGTVGIVTADLTSGALGGLLGRFLDLNEGTDFVGNRTGNGDVLHVPLNNYVGPGVSDFVLQRLPITPTGDAANVITPRVDFGAGTEGTPGDGSTIDRGGYDNGGIPPWQGLFNSLGLTADMDGDQIGGTWSGKIEITTPGDYTFTTRSDDGSVLFVNGVRIVNNNRDQGMTNLSGTVNLAAGLHDISLGAYEGAGGAGMQASYSGPDTAATRVIIPPNVLFNDVATPGTFVSGGLRGNYYDFNNGNIVGGLSIDSDQFLFNPVAPTANTPLESLRAAVTQIVDRIDFGAGTETAPGDGSVLDRGDTGGNPYGGINVNLGENIQHGAIFTGYLRVPETADYQFTTNSDDHSRIYVDINNDGDFFDANELVADKQGGGAGPAVIETGAVVNLTAGLHAFKVTTGQGTGGAAIQASWQQLTGTSPFARMNIPPSAFTTQIVGDGSFTYNPNDQFESLALGETATDTFTYRVTDSGVVGAAASMQQSSGAFAVSGNDLLEGLVATVTGTALMAPEGTSSDPAILTNGQFGTPDLIDGAQNVAISNNTTLTYALDTAANPQGYTISAINTYSGWQDGGRVDQNYSVSYATVDDPGVFVPLIPINFTSGSESVAARINNIGATRVGQIRFAFGNQENGHVGYRELDVLGSPSAPNGTVTITIVGENDLPTAEPDVGAVGSGGPAVNINLTGNDDDIDTSDIPNLEILSIDTTASSTQGMVTINPDNVSVTYDPGTAFASLALGATAIDTFTYVVTDGNGGTSTATVTVTVTGQNGPPVAEADAISIGEDGPAMSFVLTGNDTDANGDDIEIASVDTTGTLGTVTINADNDSITYNPNGQFESLAPGEMATDTFTYTVSDGNGGMSTATVTVTINGANDAPTNVNANGPYTVAEGGSVTLNGTFMPVDSNEAHTFSWDINGDGTFGDSTVQNPTLTWAELQALGINDGPGTFNATFRVIDQAGPVSSTPATLTVTNVAPSVAIAGPAVGVQGIGASFTFTAADLSSADQAANFTFNVDWGDGTSAPISGTSPRVVSHSFASVGQFTITVTATDKDGGTSASATHVIDIEPPSGLPVMVIGNDLVATGTPSGDVIIFYPSNSGVRVRYNNGVFPTDGSSYSFSGQIIANGEGGSDRIIVAGGLTQEVVFDGGIGNDYLAGGTLNDTLIGGTGNDIILAGEGNNYLDGGDDADRLEARSGNDVIFGGAGNDRLNGNAGDDILDGGSGNDFVFGGLGNDLLAGRSGIDTLNGSWGNDIILGGDDSDQIFGGSDNDLLLGGDGIDRVRGDAGDDDVIGGTSSTDAATEAALDAMMASLGTDLATASPTVRAALDAWFSTGTDRSGFGSVLNDSLVDDVSGGTGTDDMTQADSIRDFRVSEGDTFIP